jgi:hypothetical protein
VPVGACNPTQRHGMSLESPSVFYARYTTQIAVKAGHYFAVYRDAIRTLWQVLRAPDRWTCTDLAIPPPHGEKLDILGLYRTTSGGEAAVTRVLREAEARARTVAMRSRRHC